MAILVLCINLGVCINFCTQTAKTPNRLEEEGETKKDISLEKTDEFLKKREVVTLRGKIQSMNWYKHKLNAKQTKYGLQSKKYTERNIE